MKANKNALWYFDWYFVSELSHFASAYLEFQTRNEGLRNYSWPFSNDYGIRLFLHWPLIYIIYAVSFHIEIGILPYTDIWGKNDYPWILLWSMCPFIEKHKGNITNMVPGKTEYYLPPYNITINPVQHNPKQLSISAN